MTPRPLTERQCVVLRLVEDGLSNRQIADRLGISENGVKRHIASLFARYGVESRAALVYRALANGEDERLVALVRSTLADVLGQPATDVLIRRAAGTARLPGEIPTGDERSIPIAELLAGLWQGLFASTARWSPRRQQRAGFAGGSLSPTEEQARHSRW